MASRRTAAIESAPRAQRAGQDQTDSHQIHHHQRRPPPLDSQPSGQGRKTTADRACKTRTLQARRVGGHSLQVSIGDLRLRSTARGARGSRASRGSAEHAARDRQRACWRGAPPPVAASHAHEPECADVFPATKPLTAASNLALLITNELGDSCACQQPVGLWLAGLQIRLRDPLFRRYLAERPPAPAHRRETVLSQSTSPRPPKPDSLLVRAFRRAARRPCAVLTRPRAARPRCVPRPVRPEGRWPGR
jgi:hypothetical protein